MIVYKMSTRRFGELSEAAVFIHLSHAIWASRDPKLSIFDILWKGIKIEVKGTHIVSDRYYFNLGNNIYSSSKSKYHKQSKMIHPDVFVLVGWNGFDINYWIISKKKICKKHSLIITKNSKWNKYKIKDPRDLGKSIEMEII